MKAGRKKSLASVAITLTIIAMLILSQPAASLLVSLTGPDTSIVGKTVTFTAKIEIQSEAGEWSHIKDIRLNVEKDGQTDSVSIPVNLTPGAVVLENAPLANTNSTVANVTVNSTTNAVFGWGYGYGYVNNGYGYLGWGYGYGYGYGYGCYGYGYGYNVIGSPSNAVIAYDIAWKPNETGTYNFKLVVTVVDRNGKEVTFESDVHTINVYSKSVIAVAPQSTTVEVDKNVTVDIVIDKIPYGLSGYNITIKLSNSSVAEISSFKLPSWAWLNDSSTMPAGSVWIKAVDLNDSIRAGATNVTLASITLKGKEAGTTSIGISITQMDDDNGNPIEAIVQAGTLAVSPVPTPTPTPTPVLEVSPTSISKEITAGRSASVTITISNTGDAELKEVNLSASGGIANWISFSQNNIPSIAVDQSVPITVTISVPSGASAGTYSGVINVTSENGGSKDIPVSVKVKVPSPAPPSGGGGGAGGGGVVVAPAVPAHAEVTYSVALTVPANTERKVELPQAKAEATGVLAVSFKVPERMTLEVHVSKLKSLPAEVPEPPAKVYGILEITFRKYGTNIEVEPAGHIDFKVSKSWIAEKGYDPANVILMKYHEGWKELKTELTGEDENNYYYRAETGSFSVFAIAVKAVITPTPTPTVTPVTTPTVTPTVTPTPTPTPKPWWQIPGFEALLALIAIAAAGIALRRGRAR